MRSIWKFKLNPAEQFVHMPRGARVLSAGVQGNDICVWAVVDPEAEKCLRAIKVYPTGSFMPPADNIDSAVFVGTVFLGWLVFHVFDSGE